VKPTVEVKDSVPNKTVELKEKQTSNSDWPAELDLERTSEEEQKRLESENNHLQINEEKKRHQSNGTAVLENVYAVAAAAAGLTQ